MSQPSFVRRDTKAWVFQVWVAFGIALFFCAYGVLNMPNENLDRIFLATGFFFCLSSSFVLAKSIRDNQNEQVDTPVWKIQVWIAFVVAAALTSWGICNMAMADWQRGYMMTSWLFLISATFTLAKTVRDSYEADLLEQSLRSETASVATARH